MSVLDQFAWHDPASDPATGTAAASVPGWLNTVGAHWGDYRYPVILGALAAVVAFLAVSLIVAKVKGHTDRWISALAWAAGFGFSAEGMWVVTTQKAHITPIVAIAVFFVGEAFMLNSMTHARAAYLRTTVRDADGKVTKAGDPGKHGRAVWIIASAMALVVAFASKNPAEVMLRASIPLGVAMLWWNTLTAEGTGRAKGRFAWTPTRLLEQMGALVPDEDPDLAKLARERRINAMVVAADRAHAGGWRAARAARRLRRLARTADVDMMAAVRQRVAQAVEAVDRLVPARPVTDALPTAPWWTVVAPWPYLSRLEMLAADMRSAHAVERSDWQTRINGLVAEHRAALDAERATFDSRVADLESALQSGGADAERARLEVVHLAERLDAERAERAALQSRYEATEQARQAAETILLALQREAATATDQDVAAKQSGAPRSKQAKPPAATNAPKMTDAQAVRAMCKAHPEQGFAWSKREVYRITGAGFGRIDKLLEALTEHRRSTPECDCAERAGDDTEERVS